VLRTHNHARRFQPNLSPMRAVVALGRSSFIGIDINRIVRASLHTRLAPNAPLGTEINDAILALVHRSDWTNRHARWIFAVIAARYLEYAACVGKRSLLDILNPCPIHCERNVVLGLAGHGAGVTPNALAIINDESVSHAECREGPSIVAEREA
jgi:hypothetical protein